jgi:hypothetical protein
MKNWIVSLDGAITLSAVAFLTFIGRAFMDWRFEYPLQDPEGSWATLGAVIYMLLAGGWLWGLLAATKGSQRGLIVCLIWAVILNVALALATFFIFCPPWTDCVGWPNAWLWNWLNLISGLLASVAIVFPLRRNKAAR